MIDPAGFAENLALRKESARHTLRVASKEELQKRLFEAKLRTVSLSFTILGPIEACGTCTPASARALVYSGQIASKRFPNCARRPEFFNVAQMTRLRLLH